VVASRTTVVGEVLNDVEFDRAGTLLAFASGAIEGYRGTKLDVELWDWQRDEVVRRIPVSGDAFLSFHPDGGRIVVTEPERATVVDVSSGEDVAVLSGAGAPFMSVAYSPDGSLIATGHEDGVVRVWDAESGRPVTVLRGQSSGIKTVVFSPDGDRVAASDSVATVRVSTLDVDELVEIARAQVTRDLSDLECRQYLGPADCSTG
jgi:WD40 repeat protein